MTNICNWRDTFITYIQFSPPGTGACARSASARLPWRLLQTARQDARTDCRDFSTAANLSLSRPPRCSCSLGQRSILERSDFLMVLNSHSAPDSRPVLPLPVQGGVKTEDTRVIERTRRKVRKQNLQTLYFLLFRFSTAKSFATLQVLGTIKEKLKDAKRP